MENTESSPQQMTNQTHSQVTRICMKNPMLGMALGFAFAVAGILISMVFPAESDPPLLSAAFFTAIASLSASLMCIIVAINFLVVALRNRPQ
jgi:uncharacterized membrane protein